MKAIEFYLNDFKYFEGVTEADIDFIPPDARRHLSMLDKAAAAALNACMEDNIENIIFSSKTGEIEKILKLIERYKTENAVSPALFSSSMPNYPAGAYLINIQKPVPYTVLSAGDETFASGLLAAAVSKYNNLLYVCSDIQNSKHVSLCLNISKTKKETSKTFKIELNRNIKTAPALKDYAKLFSGIIRTVKTLNYTVSKGFDD